jgi:hypothetical protein
MSDTTPQEIVHDALVKAALHLQADMIRRAKIECGYRNRRETVVDAGDGVWRDFCAAIRLPRTTIEEAEARGAAKERERLAVELEGNATRYPAWIVWDVPDPMSGPVNMLAADWLRAQGGDNAG